MTNESIPRDRYLNHCCWNAITRAYDIAFTKHMYFSYHCGFIDCSLQRRHNERDDVSNPQRLDYLLNRLFRRRSKKNSKLRITGLLWRESASDRWIPITKRPVTRKMFPFDDVIMCFRVICKFCFGVTIMKISLSYYSNIILNSLAGIFTVRGCTVALTMIACCSITQTPTGQPKDWRLHARKMLVIYLKRI